MPTCSWDAGLCIISAQLHCILRNTITRRDSDSSWRWEELMLCVMWVNIRLLHRLIHGVNCKPVFCRRAQRLQLAEYVRWVATSKVAIVWYQAPRLSEAQTPQTHHALVSGWPHCRPVSNKPHWLQKYVIDWQQKAANVSRWQRSFTAFYTFVY